MVDPTLALTTAIENATKVANTPLFTTVIDRITGFRISKWAAEWEVRKKIIHDEYEKAKENWIMWIQYIEDLRHTTNLIDTAVKSSKYVDPSKKNEIAMDNDFFRNTVEHAKTISNEEVQELIAKIIAGEYNNPGSYSMSTLNCIKMLGKKEIELLERMGSLIINWTQIPKTLFTMPKDARDFLNELQIDFWSLQILQNLGIFLPNNMSRRLENPEKQKFAIQYFDQQIIFDPVNETVSEIKMPEFYGLSITWREIIKHLNPKFNNEYFNWLKINYKIPNYKTEL